MNDDVRNESWVRVRKRRGGKSSPMLKQPFASDIRAQVEDERLGSPLNQARAGRAALRRHSPGASWRVVPRLLERWNWVSRRAGLSMRKLDASHWTSVTVTRWNERR
jgi:hypothetical protein